MKKALLASLLISASLLSGCVTVDLSTGGIRAPVAMSSNINRDYSVIRHFERPLKGWFTLFDLITVQHPKVEEAIREELERSDGDGVVNVEIRGQDTFIDRLIPAALSAAGVTFTALGVASYSSTYSVVGALLSIAASQIRVRTYTVRGDVVRYTGGAEEE